MSHLVSVACRKPKTRSAAEGSSPSARAASTIATCWEGVFSRYKGVSRRALNVVWHAWQRNVWIGSARPCLPSPTSAWARGSVLLKYRHCGFGQANPSVFTRLGAPRRLFTSHQGRTGTGTGSPADEAGEASRQAGQSSGVRGLRSRWTVEWMAPPLEGEVGRWSQPRCQSSARERRKNTNKNKNI